MGLSGSKMLQITHQKILQDALMGTAKGTRLAEHWCLHCNKSQTNKQIPKWSHNLLAVSVIRSWWRMTELVVFSGWAVFTRDCLLYSTLSDHKKKIKKNCFHIIFNNITWILILIFYYIRGVKIGIEIIIKISLIAL